MGVAFLRKDGSGCQLDARPRTEEETAAYISGLEDFMITEFSVQHEYASRIYPGTTNTLRLLTLWDYNADAPFLAQAVHRIGTSRSFPVDNFRMGAGGLSAWIYLDTGELGPAACKHETGAVEWHDTHPETGAPIRGVRLPCWKETTEDILRLSARLPFIPFLGWDVVLTAEGYQVLELNPGSGFFLFQIHQPPLKDPRIRRFFESRGIV